jgi:hypothetical protein
LKAKFGLPDLVNPFLLLANNGIDPPDQTKVRLILRGIFGQRWLACGFQSLPVNMDDPDLQEESEKNFAATVFELLFSKYTPLVQVSV